MEIQTEEDHRDEGIDTTKENDPVWSSGVVKNNLFRQIALQHWKKYKTIKNDTEWI